MQTQTLDDLKRAKALKVKLTSKGYEATLKGDTPDAVVTLAGIAYVELIALRERQAAPQEKDRSEFPALVISTDGGYSLQRAGGMAGPWNPVTQAVEEDYRIKVDFVFNSKGPGWEITVNKCASIDEAVALLDYTEKALSAAFPAPTKGA